MFFTINKTDISVAQLGYGRWEIDAEFPHNKTVRFVWTDAQTIDDLRIALLPFDGFTPKEFRRLMKARKRIYDIARNHWREVYTYVDGGRRRIIPMSKY